MKITKIDYLGKCKDTSIRERFRYYEGMPPLGPGHMVAPDQPQPDAIQMPTTLEGPHRVYMVEGDDVLPNETATFYLIKGEPACWFAQSGMVLQGRKAIKRVFGDLYDWEKVSAFDLTIDAIRTALARNSSPDGKYLFATDTGDGWHVELSNDTDIMDAFREFLSQRSE